MTTQPEPVLHEDTMRRAYADLADPFRVDDARTTAAFDRFIGRVRAQAIRDVRAAFYAKHEDPPTLEGAHLVERVGARHATNVCMNFLAEYAEDQETAR